MDQLVIRPEDLLSRPFLDCPHCKKQQTFGRMMVCGKHYVRRCYKCGATEHLPLPILDRTIIYLDQFAVSNMMKALNPRTAAHQKGKFAPGTVEERWLRLFEKLDRLQKMQLIVCPYAEFHEKESMPDPHFQSLKRMYEQLSGTINFRPIPEIHARQIFQAAKTWITSGAVTVELDPQKVMYGKLSEWHDTIMLTFVRKVTEEKLKGLEEFRAQSHSLHKAMFDGWRASGGKTVREFQTRHLLTYWQTILQEYTDIGLGKHSPFAASSNAQIVRAVAKIFKDAGVTEDQLADKLTGFFLDPSIQLLIPYPAINSLLYAYLAHEASSVGSKMQPPNKGTYYDTQMIATLLPYCDAMLIQDGWRAYLKREPGKSLLAGLGTELFSPKSMDEFFQYLDDIERRADPSHLAKVAEVYGEIEPYSTMYIDSDPDTEKG